MRAGKLRHLVSIERAAKTRGEYGEEVETWAELRNAWVEIKPISGSETIQGGQVDARVTHQIAMRHGEIVNSDRINFSGRIFNLTRVLDIHERGRELLILAIEDV